MDLSSVLYNSKKIQLNLIGTPREIKNNMGNNNKNLEFASSSSRIKILSYLNSDSKFNKKYSILKPISERRNKSIFIIQKNKSDKKYILKLQTNSDSTSEKIIFNILKNNKNPYIISCREYHEAENYYYFIYDYFDGTTLSDYCQGLLLEPEIKLILNQIIQGIKFLHKLNIIHADLKLENILIKNLEIKIIDFDLSILCDNPEGIISKNLFGTCNYIAPESYDLYIYSKKSDIWTIGIILYYLITNKFPVNNINTRNSDNFGRYNQYKHIDFDLPKNIIKKNKYNPEILILLKSLLEFEDSHRPDIQKIDLI